MSDLRERYARLVAALKRKEAWQCRACGRGALVSALRYCFVCPCGCADGVCKVFIV